MDGNYSLSDIAAATGNGRNNDGRDSRVIRAMLGQKATI